MTFYNVRCGQSLHGMMGRLTAISPALSSLSSQIDSVLRRISLSATSPSCWPEQSQHIWADVIHLMSLFRYSLSCMYVMMGIFMHIMQVFMHVCSENLHAGVLQTAELSSIMAWTYIPAVFGKHIACETSLCCSFTKRLCSASIGPS